MACGGNNLKGASQLLPGCWRGLSWRFCRGAEQGSICGLCDWTPSGLQAGDTRQAPSPCCPGSAFSLSLSWERSAISKVVPGPHALGCVSPSLLLGADGPPGNTAPHVLSDRVGHLEGSRGRDGASPGSRRLHLVPLTCRRRCLHAGVFRFLEAFRAHADKAARGVVAVLALPPTRLC